ncbi:MAG: hypothetical protein U0236_10975 [Nitrospira sp.]
MNELVNFARQQLGRQSAEHESSAMRSPGDRPQDLDWLSQWRLLARTTEGLTSEDPRLNPVLDVLADCDRHYKAGDLSSFTEQSERVKRLMCFAPGAKVRWHGSENHRLCILGPATVEQVIVDGGRLIVFVIWKGIGRWISETIIKKIEMPMP